jgi:hypothetical protein
LFGYPATQLPSYPQLCNELTGVLQSQAGPGVSFAIAGGVTSKFHRDRVVRELDAALCESKELRANIELLRAHPYSWPEPAPLSSSCPPPVPAIRMDKK